MEIENKFSNNNLIKLILRWRLHLFIIFCLSVILSAIFSGPKFITPKYKSYAIVYPSNLIPYSSETETEQMLQIFKGNDIRDSIIIAFDLANYYKINKGKEHYKTTLIKEYEKNVSIRKTEFESVTIEVLDKDPVHASEMANAIIKYFNRKVRNMHKEKSQEVLIITAKQMALKTAQIDSVSSLINKMSTEYKIIDYEAQAKEVTRGYLKTIDGAGGAQINTKAVEEMKKNLEEKGSDFILLNNYLIGLMEQYIDLKTEYEIALRDVEKDLTYTNIVSYPLPADKKSYPIRWLIVFIATLSTMFVSIMFIIFIDKLKKEI